jgi:hypothetical protein
MSRFSILLHGLLTSTMLWLTSPGPARGDQEDDDRLARRLVTAAGKYSDLHEVKARYGRRAEIALTILHDERVRMNLVTEVRDMQTVIATFPQNRRWWLGDQQDYFNQKLALDRQLNALDRELGELRLEEKRMYEEELEKARASGRAVKPFHREALLSELQRPDRESGEAVAELKEGIESAAREGRTTRRRVLDRVVTRLASLDAPPGVGREFLPRFIQYAGGDRWLDGANMAGAGKGDAKKKPPAGKSKKEPSRARKSRARSDVAAS